MHFGIRLKAVEVPAVVPVVALAQEGVLALAVVQAGAQHLHRPLRRDQPLVLPLLLELEVAQPRQDQLRVQQHRQVRLDLHQLRQPYP